MVEHSACETAALHLFFLITAFISGKAGFSTAYLVVWGSTTAFTFSLVTHFKSKTRASRVFSLLECFPWPLQARYPEGHRRKCYARYISNSIFKTNKHINNTSRSRLVVVPLRCLVRAHAITFACYLRRRIRESLRHDAR